MARLRGTKTTRELCIRELLYADAAAIVAHAIEDTRKICKQSEQAATLFGLIINTKTSVTLYQHPPGQTSIDSHVEIYGTPLKSVKNFTYLGSTVASDNIIDVEINNRIHSTSGAIGRLWKLVWSQHGIIVFTKCKVYKAIVLPTLLYSAETYILYRRHFRKLLINKLPSVIHAPRQVRKPLGDKVKAKPEELVERDIITEPEWVSSILAMVKSHKVIRREHYHMSNIEIVAAGVTKAKRFTVVDTKT